MTIWAKISVAIKYAATFAALLSVPYVILYGMKLFEEDPITYRDLKTIRFEASCTQLGLSSPGVYEGLAFLTRNESTGETNWWASASRQVSTEEMTDLTGRYYPPIVVYFWERADSFGDHIEGDTFRAAADGDVSTETEDKSVPMECEVKVVCSAQGRGCGSPPRRNTTG